MVGDMCFGRGQRRFGPTTAINGQSFEMDRIDVEAKRGTLELWKIGLQMMARPAQIFVLLAQLATRNHPLMFHCHILEHENAGMMGQYVCT
jgi:blue copper oxidase